MIARVVRGDYEAAVDFAMIPPWSTRVDAKGTLVAAVVQIVGDIGDPEQCRRAAAALRRLIEPGDAPAVATSVNDGIAALEQASESAGLAGH